MPQLLSTCWLCVNLTGIRCKDHDLEMRGAARGVHGMAHRTPPLTQARAPSGAVHLMQARSACGGELGKGHVLAPTSTLGPLRATPAVRRNATIRRSLSRP